MTFVQFFSILWARKWVALLVLGLILGGATGFSLLLPKQYTGVASIVLDTRPDPIAPYAAGGTMLAQSFMATQVDVMTSDRVAMKVIQATNLLDAPALQRQWAESTQGKGTIEQWLVQLLKRELDVRPSRESNVINISYKAAEPRFAAGIANAFAQAYIAVTLELRANPAKSFKVLFDDQTQVARETLVAAQEKLAAFNQQKRIIATDERYDVENFRLNELSSQLIQLQAIAAESSSRYTQAQAGQVDRMSEVLNNPFISQLKADLSRSEVRVDELTARLGENHPQVVEIRANVAQMRSRIEAETRRVASGVGITNTINRSRETQVKRELEEQRKKVLQLKAIRDEGVLIARDVDSAQRIYDGLAVRQHQTTLESQNSQSFANQLTIAQPPIEHSSPRTTLHMLLALFLGTFIAIAAALILEMLDRRVRSTDDIIGALGLPVLGTLPPPNAKRYRAGHRALPSPNQIMYLNGPASPSHGT